METTEKDWLFRELVDFLRGNVCGQYVGSRKLLSPSSPPSLRTDVMCTYDSGRKYSFVRLQFLISHFRNETLLTYSRIRRFTPRSLLDSPSSSSLVSTRSLASDCVSCEILRLRYWTLSCSILVSHCRTSPTYLSASLSRGIRLLSSRWVGLLLSLFHTLCCRFVNFFPSFVSTLIFLDRNYLCTT